MGLFIISILVFSLAEILFSFRYRKTGVTIITTVFTLIPLLAYLSTISDFDVSFEVELLGFLSGGVVGLSSMGNSLCEEKKKSLVVLSLFLGLIVLILSLMLSLYFLAMVNSPV